MPAAGEEKARAFDAYVTYCGRYRVDGDVAYHRIEMSLLPNWIGEEQARRIEWEDDDRIRLRPNEVIQAIKVRFRTLGCYPLTGGIESNAESLPDIILELLNARSSERQGRAIDADASASMEKKKQEGYF